MLRRNWFLFHDFAFNFRLTLVLSCPMHFKNYPHDTQECNLEIESSEFFRLPTCPIFGFFGLPPCPIFGFFGLPTCPILKYFRLPTCPILSSSDYQLALFLSSSDYQLALFLSSLGYLLLLCLRQSQQLDIIYLFSAYLNYTPLILSS